MQKSVFVGIIKLISFEIERLEAFASGQGLKWPAKWAQLALLNSCCVFNFSYKFWAFDTYIA
jgi:hypothetical protein